MIKKFLEEHTHLKLAIQHLGIYGGGFMVQVYNTTWDSGYEPIHEHFISDFEIEHLRVDFETAIMTPIVNWWEEIEKERRERMAKERE